MQCLVHCTSASSMSVNVRRLVCLSLRLCATSLCAGSKTPCLLTAPPPPPPPPPPHPSPFLPPSVLHSLTHSLTHSCTRIAGQGPREELGQTLDSQSWWSESHTWPVLHSTWMQMPQPSFGIPCAISARLLFAAIAVTFKNGHCWICRWPYPHEPSARGPDETVAALLSCTPVAKFHDNPLSLDLDNE